MINNKKGYCLVYILFIFILLINILTTVILCNLNRNSYYIDKDKYYQIFILEERAKKHVKERFMTNQPINNETELLYFDDDFIYFLYQYNDEREIWNITYRISYQKIDQKGIIIYDTTTSEISIEIQ